MWLGFAAAMIGLLVSGTWFIWHLLEVDDEVKQLQRIEATSETVLTVVEPVEWTIFIEPGDRSLSGVRYAIVSLDGGEPVTLSGASGFSYSVPSGSGRAIGKVTLGPGQYRVVLAPSEVTLAIGESPAGTVARMLWGAFLLGGPLVVGGGGIAIVSAIRHSHHRAITAPPPEPSKCTWT